MVIIRGFLIMFFYHEGHEDETVLVSVHRFTGSGFAFILPALLINQQVLDETTNGGAGTSGMIIHILKFSFRNVLLIERHVKLTLDLGARPLCIPKFSSHSNLEP